MTLEELLELRDDVVERIRSSVEENVTEDFDEPKTDGKQVQIRRRTAQEDDPLSEESVSARYDIDDMPEFMETDEGRLMVIKARPRFSLST